VLFTQLSKEIGEALLGYGLPVFKSFTSQRVIYAKSAAIGSTNGISHWYF
jgi:hypothetical protein